MKRILFLHGLESKPGGSKVAHLSSLGYEILNPLLSADDFNDSLNVAQKELKKHPDIIVGSSRGGALALALRDHDLPLVLIAPAWRRFGVSTDVGAGTVILHSEHDDIVPFEDTQELFRKNTGLEVIACGNSHRMNDKDAMHHLADAVERLIG